MKTNGHTVAARWTVARGVGYTVERQLPNGAWSIASPETEGLDVWREWIPETTDDHGLFRVTARSL